MTIIDQVSLFEEAEARSLIDQLLDDSRLYTTTQSYMELLSFTSKLKSFAPFNAMLLHMQKPGLSFAASAYDWKFKFGRHPKPGARPLMILWPFGPVAFVYDVQDTEGSDLPSDVTAFWARGEITAAEIAKMSLNLTHKSIRVAFFDGGDNSAGSIQVTGREEKPKPRGFYRMMVNRNHAPATQLVTIAHELGHLFLGHLGNDSELKVPNRTGLSHAQIELEAESVAYLVASRTGIESKSEKYLSNYVKDREIVGSLDLYNVVRAAGQVETILGLHRGTSFGPKPTRSKKIQNG
ncbi:MAG: ImmA/IrrE family metallo-endopeptidase [Armatimonadetes bacterium]|nr:ImmA/IrrE family metallo-endopeptidase [Armatimonadota bacterium]MBS1726037.1 ImmA/IrrE family metallo-endopeptidase [Armatimonadota bacterium]